MGMTGLQIYKLLPRTNCKKCGYATCLAFGMALSSGKTTDDKCESMSDSLRNTLKEASLTPVRECVFGNEKYQYKIGGEKVIFRHEETFYNLPCIAPCLSDDLPEDEFIRRAEIVNNYKVIRAGIELKTGALAIEHKNGDLSKYVSLVNIEKPLIIISDDTKAIYELLEKEPERRPLIICKSASDDDIKTWSLKYNAGVTIFGDSVEQLHDKAEKMGDIKNVVFCSNVDFKEQVLQSSISRFSAIHFRQKTHPFITLLNSARNIEEEIMFAGFAVQRFLGCIITSFESFNKILPLLTLANGVYSDPRRPVQVEPKLYPINNPDNNSPVFVTTNFSLTHFLVSSEIEASRKPAWLLIVDTDGTSLLTAWASDKFNAEAIHEAIKKNDVESKVSHRSLVICSYVYSMKEEIEEKTGWKVILGTGEASGISTWLKKLDYSSL